MLWTGWISCDERQVQLRLGRGGKLALRTLGRFLQPLQREPIGSKIDPRLLFKGLDHPVDDSLIEVLSPEKRIAAGREHFEHAVAHFHDGDIKRAAAQVVHRDLLTVAFAEAVCECGGRRLVDDSLNRQPGNLARVLCSLALNVVEVRGHGDDRFGDFVAEKLFGGLLESLKQDCRNLGRRVIACPRSDAAVTVGRVGDFVRADLASSLNFCRVELAAHQPLDRIDRVRRVRDGLAFCYLADQPLAFLGESDYRRRGSSAFFVWDNLRDPAFEYRHTRVGRAQVYSNHFAHERCLLVQ